MERNRSPNPGVMKAINAGKWRDPGSDALSRILGEGLNLSDLELFTTPEAMHAVKEQVDEGGYIDDPEFCMVRSSPTTDDWLVFDSALFIAGSVDPGDDVFVVVDGDNVRVFDWRTRPPHRWLTLGSVDWFVAGIVSAGN